MSLINDALKKAQRQRTEGSTPPAEISAPSASPGQPLQRVVRREKPAGFRSQLFLIAGAAAAVVLLALGAVVFLRQNEAPVDKAKAAQVASSAPSIQAPATPLANPAAVAPTAPAVVAPASPALTLPPAPVASANLSAPAQPASPALASPAPAEAVPTTVATTAAQFVIPSAAPQATEPTAAAAAVATAPGSTERPKASTRMIAVIEHFRVGGIRIAGAESKVLMNDRVYRINDIVDYELNIRLTNIEAKALTFEDARGAIHTRTF